MAIIAHLDMDAFFAAVEERNHPRLKGRPIVVGADPLNGRGRGVVSTANYKAREYGIHSAMPISRAWQLAEAGRKAGGPAVVFMGGNFEAYNEASGRIMGILRKYALRVEQASIDEAYFDLSAAANYAVAAAIAKKIKAEIKRKEKLTASIGLGPNKMIAKIASDSQKPDGLTIIEPDQVQGFLAPLPIRKIPGIGPKSEAGLMKSGVRTVADLQKLSKAELVDHFGKWGVDLYNSARGIASAAIVEEWTAKSIGQEHTFSQDTLDSVRILKCMEELAADVARRFTESEFKTFRTIVLKVRFENFTTVTRSRTLTKPESDAGILKNRGVQMIMPFLDSRENAQRKKLRLLGLRIEKLV